MPPTAFLAGNDIEQTLPAGIFRQAVLVHLLRLYQEVLHMDIQKFAQRVKVIYIRQ